MTDPTVTKRARRPKNPEHVRQALIEATRTLGLKQGLASVTTQAVAREAGVTKGGLFHHFENKQVLVHAVFDQMLEELQAKLEALMAAQRSVSQGAFTRAYIDVAVDAEESRWGPVWMTTLTEPTLREKWSAWFDGMVERRGETDERLAAARLAADGYWLSRLASSRPIDPDTAKRAILSLAGLS